MLKTLNRPILDDILNPYKLVAVLLTPLSTPRGLLKGSFNTKRAQRLGPEGVSISCSSVPFWPALLQTQAHSRHFRTVCSHHSSH